MAKYKYKLKEEPFKVGDTNTGGGVKTTVKDIDPETGAISWDVNYVPAFDSVFREFDELRKAIAQLDQKTEDSVIDDIATNIKAEFNRYRTHLRKNYPDAYKKVGPTNEEELEEMSTTNSGGASFTSGKGAQYATPHAFKKGKGANKATKFMYKLGYKPAPSIPNRKSKVMDYKKLEEAIHMYERKLNEAENEVETFQQKRIHDFEELKSRLTVIAKKLEQAKKSTDRYYRENPKSYAVVYGTDMINDYLNDIEQLLTQD